MAKNFPYFKFTASKWMTGDIVFEDFDIQGLFINICALYWQRDGDLSIDDINKRYKNPKQLPKLTDRFFSVIDGYISIKFLDEQLDAVTHISRVNSENGKLGGRPKTLSNKPTANRPLTDGKPKKSNKEKKREEKIYFNNSIIFDKIKFKESFPDWGKEKLLYYYEAALRYSNEGNKYVDWVATVKNWAKKDELQGKIKFDVKPKEGYSIGDGIL